MKQRRLKPKRSTGKVAEDRSGADTSPAKNGHQDWNLCFYIAGPTAESSVAYRNLKEICDEHLPGRYNIEVIDLIRNPEVAREDQIVALPTVVRKHPLPLRKIIGDLSNTERALAALDLGVRKARSI